MAELREARERDNIAPQEPVAGAIGKAIREGDYRAFPRLLEFPADEYENISMARSYSESNVEESAR